MTDIHERIAVNGSATVLKLICMRGYSSSGKSTRAAAIAKESGAAVVNRDLLRLMLLGSYWTGKSLDEDRVTIAEEHTVRALLRNGTSVVVDATHLNPSYLRKWARMATRLGADFNIVDVRTDPLTCIGRDFDREQQGERSVGHKVIRDQAKRWPMEKWPDIKADPPFRPVPVEYIEGLPDAIIVDIDGTVAHIPPGGRSPYDYNRVKEDMPDPIIIQLVRDWQAQNRDGFVLFVSGRDDTCYFDTYDWLIDNDISFDHLWMRPTDALDGHGGKLPDFIVKADIFDKHIRGQYNIKFCFDDRLQVCRLWHQLGLKVLRVGDPDADF